jgi:predicted nuclease with TOPRIM domain
MIPEMRRKARESNLSGEERRMSTLLERVHDDVEKLRQRRDELRVQIDLGKMEAADAWHEVEERWQRLEGKLGVLAGESKDAAEDVGKAASQLVEEIREGLARVARHL